MNVADVKARITRSKTGDGVLALVMLWFSIPKLIGAARSVEGFRVIGAFLGVDPVAPRLFTGVVELIITSVLVGSLWAPVALRQKLGLAAHAMLVATMSGAALTELVIRPGAANGLLALATLIGAFSILRILQLRGPATPHKAKSVSHFEEATR